MKCVKMAFVSALLALCAATGCFAEEKLFAHTKAFLSAVKADGLKYRVAESEAGRNDIMFDFRGDNVSTITVTVVFVKDEPNLAALRAWNLVKVPENKLPKVYELLSRLSRDYKFCKFTYDPTERTVDIYMELITRPDSAGEVTREGLSRMVDICDEAYPILMKAIYE